MSSSGYVPNNSVLGIQPTDGARPRVVDGNADPVGPATALILGEYCLTLQAAITQQFVGETQGGHRIDLEYTGSGKSVNFDRGNSALTKTTLNRLAKAPSLVSGNDWVFLSRTGQIDFDSRITVSFGDGTPSNPRCLVGGRIRGRTNLRECRFSTGGGLVFSSDDTDEAILTRWNGGLGASVWLPLVLAVSFDVPTTGLEANQTESFDDARELERTLFIARGHAKFRDGEESPVALLVLDLYRPRVDWSESTPSPTNGAGPS